MASLNLLDMPAEIRNMIYNFHFNDTMPGEHVDLRHPQPPSSSLLSTCHQIRSETEQMHHAACQRYWAKSKFFIDVRKSEGVVKDEAVITAHKSVIDSGAIQRLYILGGKWIYAATAEPGIWSVTERDPTFGIASRFHVAIYYPTSHSRRLGSQPCWMLVGHLSRAQEKMASVCESMVCTRYEEAMRVFEQVTWKFQDLVEVREIFWREQNSPSTCLSPPTSRSRHDGPANRTSSTSTRSGREKPQIIVPTHKMAAGFLGLPAELRNMIYGHVLSRDDQDWIDLRSACPRTSPLLLVNGQINSESKGLFQAACRHYWSSNFFYLDTPTVTSNDKARVRKIDLSLIQNLRLAFQAAWGAPTHMLLLIELDLIDPRGVWSVLGYHPHYKAGISPLQSYYVLKRHDDEGRPTSRVCCGHVFDSRGEAMENCESQRDFMSVYDQIEAIIECHVGCCRDFGLPTVPYVPGMSTGSLAR